MLRHGFGMTLDEQEVARSVRDYYTRQIESGSCCGAAAASACVAPDATAARPSVAPDATAAERASPALDIPSFGCGDPTASAALAAGETVLDLGSGAGLDAVRAAAAVGPSGRVIGVDMTPAMLERARAAAARLGLEHVDFRHGLIEDLPVADASVDVVISNCVINLSTDKAAVFREIERVLVPGGRMRVSDILVHREHARRATMDGWCGCVDGAIDADGYRRHARRAGLVDVVVDPARPPVEPGATYSATVTAAKADVRPATDDDASRAAALLETAGLPTAGWDAPDTRRWVLIHDGQVGGAVAVELLGGEALVRSLVVEPDLRGRGFGGALLAAASRAAVLAGSARLYGLTTTIPDWLARLGFLETTRERLPAALFASAELQGACPDAARAFELALEGRRRAPSDAPQAAGAEA